MKLSGPTGLCASKSRPAVRFPRSSDEASLLHSLTTPSNLFIPTQLLDRRASLLVFSLAIRVASYSASSSSITRETSPPIEGLTNRLPRPLGLQAASLLAMAAFYDYAAPSSSSSSSSSTDAQWLATPTSIVQQKALIGALICIGANTLVSLALNVQKKAHQQQEAEDNGDEEDDEEAEQPRRSGSGETEQQPQSQHTRTTGYGGTTNGEGAAARRSQPQSNGSDEGQHRRSDSSQSGSGGGHSGGPNAKFLRSRLWWLGFALMTTGEAGNFICT